MRGDAASSEHSSAARKPSWAEWASSFSPFARRSDDAQVVLLRESEALLALLQQEAHAAPEPVPLVPLLGQSVDVQLKAPSALANDQSPPAALKESWARLEACPRGSAQMRDELGRCVSDARLPLGAALYQFVSDFRKAYEQRDTPLSDSLLPLESTPAAATPPPPPSSRPVGLPERLWRLGRGSAARDTPSPSTAALDAAVERVRDGITSLSKQLAMQLPPSLRSDPSVVHEAVAQLDAAVHRALSPSLSPLYLVAHAAPIAHMARQCHEMRTLLPSDLLLPLPLTLLPLPRGQSASSSGNTAAAGGGGAGAPTDPIEQLRTCGASDPRLPYASAIRLLRTIAAYRTPSEKAKVLLDACEEVVKIATRALTLSAAAKAAATAAAAAVRSDGGARDGPAPSALGADDLLPLVVYVLVRSRVTALPAELAFVSDFLPGHVLHGKEGYALVSLQCACRVCQELTWESTGGLLKAPLQPLKAEEEEDGSAEVDDLLQRGAQEHQEQMSPTQVEAISVG